MDRYLKAQLAVLAFFLALLATAGCISWLSAEPQPDGGAIVCAKVLPSPDAGEDAATGAGTGPTMRYVPVHAGGGR